MCLATGGNGVGLTEHIPCGGGRHVVPPHQTPLDTSLTLRAQTADRGTGASAPQEGPQSALSRGRGGPKRGSVSWVDESAVCQSPREAGRDKSTQTGEVDPQEGRQQLVSGSVREPKTEQVPVPPVQVQEAIVSKPEADSGVPKAKGKAQARKSSVDDGSSGRGRDKARRNSGEHQ